MSQMRIYPLLTLPLACFITSAQAQVVSQDSPKHYRLPQEFLFAPHAVVAALQDRGCQIPQYDRSPAPNNLVARHFLAPASTDWAALCSRAGVSTLLVLHGPTWHDLDSVAAAPDLPGHGIFVAAPEWIRQRVGSVRADSLDPPITHDGVETEPAAAQ